MSGEASRAAYRGQITKIAKSAIEYLSGPESKIVDGANLDVIEEEFQAFLQRLTAAHDGLRSINKEFSEKGLIKAEDLQRDSEKVVEYEDLAINAITRLNVRLKKVIEKLHGATLPTPPKSDSSKTNSSTKLERLKLKTFGGDHKDWIPFWQQFNGAVHENSSLSGIDKFHYLQNALTGSAARTLEGFTPSSECYDSAIALLQEEYGNNERLIDMTVQQLMFLPQVKNAYDVSGLRRLYNSAVAGIRSLTSLRVPSTHFSVILKPILMKALPSALRVEYLRRSEKGGDIKEETDEDDLNNQSDANSTSSSNTFSVCDEQIQNILKFIKREVEAMEQASIYKATAVNENTERSKGHSTAAGLLTTNIASSECAICKLNGHQTRECDKEMSLNDKKKILLKEGKCFRCLSGGHRSKNCRVRNLLCKKCSGRHATIMCDPLFRKFKENTVKTESKTTNLCAYTVDSKETQIFLQTARVFVSPCNTVTTRKFFVRIILDGASQKSYIREDIADKLNVPVIKNVEMSILPFGSNTINETKRYKLVSVKLTSRYTNSSVNIEAVVVPKICADVLPVPSDQMCALKGFSLADMVMDDEFDMIPGINVLLGADYYWAVITGLTKRITEKLVIAETIFGWTLQGPYPVSIDLSNKKESIKSSPVLATFNIEEREASKFWDLEVIGIRPDEVERNETTERLQDSCINKITGRYEASLPWKNLEVKLDSNKNIAQKRLWSLVRKLSLNFQNLLDYDKIMKEFIETGMAEPATNEVGGGRCYYMPHRPVYRFDKATTKIRIVFDASSHTSTTLSLNDHLHTGTNLLPDILKIFLNFRLGRIGITADIEKAFLQISLREKDRDSHRFLWFASEIADPNNLPDLMTYRMTRVTFGVTASPFLLTATLKKHFDLEAKKFDNTCSILRESFYMDDLVVSLPNEEMALQLYNESTQIMQRAGMHLRKWNSNEERVRKTFPEVVTANQKVLGIKWITDSDQIAPCWESLINFLNENPIGSKRDVLSSIARIFDPIGIFCPVTIRLKILFQELWREKFAWNEVLPHNYLSQWKIILGDLLELKYMTISRNVLIYDSVVNKQIHIFADASTKAFGAVAYIRITNEDGEVFTTFLCAKNRVAPLKRSNQAPEITLPQLELTAAIIAVRLKCYLTKMLKLTFDEYILWSDSKIALHWIFGDANRWKPFVTNRVNEIRSKSNLTEWRHCPGSHNPADLLTRGLSAAEFSKSVTWNFGPTWLSEGQSQWPQHEFEVPSLPVALTTILTSEENDVHCVNLQEPITLPENFSLWNKLLRTTAYIFRFIRRIRRKCDSPIDIALLADEINDAERYWLKYIQFTFFSKEICLLQMSRSLPSSSRLCSLDPKLDANGLIRVGGRLQSLDEPMDFVHPIILPDCYLTRLIVKKVHHQQLHAGINSTLSKLRERFWVLKGRQIIKKTVRSCLICRKFRAKPLTQPFAPLPKDRLQFVRPFATVGMDFAGPLYIKETSKGSTVKVYILVFSCAVVRCIHLEIVQSLTTEACLLAFRRFVSRRGVPDTIYSDNAKTFRRASKDLPSLTPVLRESNFQSYLSNQRIRWKFIVERAPWWGGFWERIIRTIKDILKITIKRATLDNEQLLTLIAEAENVINDRPLTYMCDDPLDLRPLTPNTILRSYGNYNIDDVASNENASSIMRNVWKTKCKNFISLAKRWKNEYLKLLRSFHNTGKSISSCLIPGEVVLVYDQSIPRIHWKLAVVEQVFPGRDNKVRACEVRFSNGTKLRRPVQHLYPLELREPSAAGGC